MSQTWTMPTGTTRNSTAVKTDLPAALAALRSLFSGASAPSSMEAYMLHIDTVLSRLRQRNAANSAWVDIAPLLKDLGHQVVAIDLGALTASKNVYVLCASDAVTIQRVRLVPDSATTSSAGVNEWSFQLRNKTAAVNLFSAAPTTATLVSGVGGGVEFAVDTPWNLTPNQNATLAAAAVLELQITKVGTPGNTGRTLAMLEFTRTV